MNQDRARLYLNQAIALVTELETKVAIPTDSVGAWVSLRRNLESAAADLEPPKE